MISASLSGNNCGALTLQFDAGRGTTMRLALLGLTVVVVTHSERVAGRAQRVIEMRDGKVAA